MDIPLAKMSLSSVCVCVCMHMCMRVCVYVCRHAVAGGHGVRDINKQHQTNPSPKKEPHSHSLPK